MSENKNQYNNDPFMPEFIRFEEIYCSVLDSYEENNKPPVNCKFCLDSGVALFAIETKDAAEVCTTYGICECDARKNVVH